MRIMVDECLPCEVVDHLRRDGHDVHWISDDMSSVDDIAVLRAANAERRIIVSEDRDFGELVYRDQHATVGIVSVRYSEFGLLPEDMGAYVAQKVRELGDTLIGQFTVIEPGRERPRPLPNVLP